jgi:hypothetical protein
VTEKSIFEYYFFGTSLRYLETADPGATIGDLSESRIRFNCDYFLKSLKKLNLQVTERASYGLIEFLKSLEGRPDEDLLSDEEAKELRRVMARIRPTLDAEIRGFTAFVVTPKILDVQRLYHRLLNMISPKPESASRLSGPPRLFSTYSELPKDC